MTFTEAVKTCFSKYATIRGRAARPEYWWWILFVLLVSLVTQTIDATVIAPALGIPAFGEDGEQPLSMLVSLVLLVPGLAVSVRRLHDIDRSGWWMLIVLIPIIGLLVMLYWAVQPGTDGANRFGAGGERDAVL